MKAVTPLAVASGMEFSRSGSFAALSEAGKRRLSEAEKRMSELKAEMPRRPRPKPSLPPDAQETGPDHPLAAPALPPRPKCSWTDKPKKAFGGSSAGMRAESPEPVVLPPEEEALPEVRSRISMPSIGRRGSSADGRGPLWWAREFGNTDAEALLVKYKVRSDLVDSTGNSP